MSATTSRVPQFKADLLAAIRAKVTGVQAEYAWPGPNTKPESIYFGETVTGTSVVPSMRSGRVARQEDYTVTVVAWAYQPASNPLAAAAAEARAFELMAAVEDVLADDPAFSERVQWATAADFKSELLPYEKGWAVELTRSVDIQDRLN